MRAFGKLNLILKVGEVCASDFGIGGGMHPLETVMAPTRDIFDSVQIELCDTKDAGISYSVGEFCGDVHCTDKFLSTIKSDVEQLGRTFDNVRKAVDLLSTKFQIPPCKIHIEKRIPFMAGLGGSSADAVAVLRFFADYLALDFDDIQAVLNAVGNDLCGMFLDSVAFVEGDCTSPMKIADEIGGFAVVCMSDFGVSTADCFRMFDSLLESGDVCDTRDISHYISKDFNFVDNFAETFNMLEKPAFAGSSQAVEFRDSLEKVSGEKFLMTGSGSAFFTLVASKEKAVSVLEKVKGICEFACVSRV